MWGYDSSQIADLVGLFTLNILTKIITPEQLGLYHDDGLIYIPNSNGPTQTQTHTHTHTVCYFLL